MGLVSYMGHRGLSGILIIAGVLLILQGLFSGYVWIIIGIALIIAAAYFMQTKHN